MFKELRGKRILIERPEKPKSLIELTPEAEELAAKEFVKTLNKLTVAAVGNDVTNINPGDKVYVGMGITNCEVIEIDEKLYFVVPEQMVIIVW
jgi:hypothetical protein